MTEERTIRYVGQVKDGTGRTGQVTTDDLQAWVYQKFLTGWRKLAVTHADVEVGGIGTPPGEPTRHYWWAER